MKQLVRFTAVVVVFLLVGLTVASAQEVVFTSGPAVTPGNPGASNGGFAWLDINGDGLQDVFIPPNSIIYNHLTYFTAAPAVSTAAVGNNNNSVGGLFADFNGDAVPELWSTNNSAPATGLYRDSAGIFIQVTGSDLANAGGTGEVFQGAAAAPIDHSNYLSLVWPNGFTGIASANAAPRGAAMWFLKGSGNGFTFTNIAKGATAGNLAIDTSLTFESWDVHFFDANNDGYQDLLMPSFRNGFSRIDTGNGGARKGCVLFLNDGTGKFVIPTSASYYRIDSVKVNKAGTADSITYTTQAADTGIVVDDTVFHFAAIGSQWGDLNNDGNPDLILTGLNDNDNRDGNGLLRRVIILYGKGNGTFTRNWNGTNFVVSGLPATGQGIRAWDIGDYNNDGIPDIYASTTFGATRLFRGNGNGTYTEVTAQDYVATAGGGRAGGFVDYNNDGFLDIYNYTGGNSVLQKNNGNSNNWIGFVPVGTGHNMNAIGAKFTLYTQGGTYKQYRYIRAEAGSSGHGEMRALFGIGINTTIDSVNVLWPDGTSQTFTGLAVDKYWTINEGSAVPGAATLSSPANSATGANIADTLKWTAATNGVSYKVQVSLDPTFANTRLLAVNTTVSGTSYAYSLAPATKYYWRVAAVNGGFTSSYTSAFNFTTSGSAASTVPTIVAPASGAKNQAAALKLSVNKTADASRYYWQVSTLPTFVTFVVNDSTADTTYSGQFAGGQTFYMRVSGRNDLGASAFTAIDTFTIMTPPSRTTLVYPASGAQNVISDSLTFTWARVSSATSYNLMVSTVNSSVTYTGLDTSYQVRNLLKLTNYSWAVEATNAGGTSYFTGASTFTTVIAVPPAPLLGLPAANSSSVNRIPRFSWSPATNATKYRLQIATENTFTTGLVVDTTAYDTAIVIGKTLAANTPYFWQLYAINIGGQGAVAGPRTFTTGTVLDVENSGSVVPKEFALAQNYPNPFNPSTIISYDIPKTAYVSLRIYDVLGRLVTTLVDGVQAASSYKVAWVPRGMSTGVYFYRIEARSQDGSGNFSSVKKLLFMK